MDARRRDGTPRVPGDHRSGEHHRPPFRVARPVAARAVRTPACGEARARHPGDGGARARHGPVRLPGGTGAALPAHRRCLGAGTGGELGTGPRIRGPRAAAPLAPAGADRGGPGEGARLQRAVHLDRPVRAADGGQAPPGAPGCSPSPVTGAARRPDERGPPLPLLGGRERGGDGGDLRGGLVDPRRAADRRARRRGGGARLAAGAGGAGGGPRRRGAGRAAHPLGAPAHPRGAGPPRRNGRTAPRGARRGPHGAGLRGGGSWRRRALPHGPMRTPRRWPGQPGPARRCPR